MSIIMTGKSTGPTTTELQHPSGVVIKTVAPKDNGGDGSSFSPTDLCAVSLGACGSTIMTMYAAKHGIDLTSVEFEISKEMSATPPRKIAKIEVSFKLGGKFSEAEYEKIIRAAKTCPVDQTLAGNVEVVHNFTRV